MVEPVECERVEVVPQDTGAEDVNSGSRCPWTSSSKTILFRDLELLHGLRDVKGRKDRY